MTGLPLLDWTPRQASVQALEALPLRTVREDHRRILEALRQGPMTDAELLAATCVHSNALRARRGELVTAGLVVQAGSKRQENGRKACTWGLK